MAPETWFPPMRRFFAAAALALLAFPSLAPGLARADQPRVEILDYGIYATGPRTTVPMPISVSGKMNLVSDVRLTEKTREIMGQLGTSFGFRYRVYGVPDQSVSPGSERYTGYSFDSSYEIAEGEWTLQILYEGRVIGEQKFKVVV